MEAAASVVPLPASLVQDLHRHARVAFLRLCSTAVSVFRLVPMEHIQPVRVASIAFLPVSPAIAAALVLLAVALFSSVARIASRPALPALSKTYPPIIAQPATQLAFRVLPQPPIAQPAFLLLFLAQIRALPIVQPTTSTLAASARPVLIACPAPV